MTNTKIHEQTFKILQVLKPYLRIDIDADDMQEDLFLTLQEEGFKIKEQISTLLEIGELIINVMNHIDSPFYCKELQKSLDLLSSVIPEDVTTCD